MRFLRGKIHWWHPEDACVSIIRNRRPRCRILAANLGDTPYVITVDARKVTCLKCKRYVMDETRDCPPSPEELIAQALCCEGGPYGYSAQMELVETYPETPAAQETTWVVNPGVSPKDIARYLLRVLAKAGYRVE